MADYYTCVHSTDNGNDGIHIRYDNNCGIAHSTREKADECCAQHNWLVKRRELPASRRVTVVSRSDIEESMLVMFMRTTHQLGVDGQDSAEHWHSWLDSGPNARARLREFFRCTFLVYDSDVAPRTIAELAHDLDGAYKHYRRGQLITLRNNAQRKMDKARSGSKAYYTNRATMRAAHILLTWHEQIREFLGAAEPKRAEPEPEPVKQPEPVKLDHLEPIVDPQPQPQQPVLDNNATANQVAAAITQLLVGGQNNADVQEIAKQAARDAIAEASRDGSLTMTVEIQRPDKTKFVLPKDQALHSSFDDVMKAITVGESPLLKGPAGTGKSMLAKQVADALNMRFLHMSLSGGTGEHHFVGTRLPNRSGEFEHVGTPFLDAFENGGVMLLDEMDACDENVLLAINNGLANGELPVPGRDAKPYATKHEDFRLIAAANTWGSGPNAMYAGRNQLDAATLDRFMLIEVDYDRTLEKSLVPDFPLLVMAWHKLRDQANKAQLRRVVSMRGLLRYAKMTRAYDWTADKCLAHATQSWSVDERNSCEVLRG